MRRKLKKDFHRTGCSQFFFFVGGKDIPLGGKNVRWNAYDLLPFTLIFTWENNHQALTAHTEPTTVRWRLLFARLNATALFLLWWKHIAHFDSWLRTWPLQWTVWLDKGQMLDLCTSCWFCFLNLGQVTNDFGRGQNLTHKTVSRYLPSFSCLSCCSL